MALIHWWPLNGDFTDKGINSKQINVYSTRYSEQNGKFNKCIKTNGDGEIDLLVNPNEWNPTDTPLTLSAWVKFNKNDIRPIVEAAGCDSTRTGCDGNIIGGNSYGGYCIYWKTNNIFADKHFTSLKIGTNLRTSSLWNNPDEIIINDTGKYKFDQWIHVCSVFHKDKYNRTEFYVNGEYIGASIDSSFGVYRTDAPFIINRATTHGGNDLGKNIPFYIQDVRLYTNALSKKEIQLLSQACILNYDLTDIYNEPTKNMMIESKTGGHGSTWNLMNYKFHNHNIYHNVVTNPNVGNNSGFRYLSDHFAIPETTTHITISFYKKLNKVYGKSLIGYCRVNYTDGSAITHTWSYKNNKSNWANDSSSLGKWEKIEATVTLKNGKIPKDLNCMYIYADKATGGDCEFSEIQMEFNDHATPYVESINTYGERNEIIIADNSGFGNDGKIIGGKFHLIQDSEIGNISTKMDGHTYIETKQLFFDNQSQTHTINLWVKPEINNKIMTIINFNRDYRLFYSASHPQALVYVASGNRADSYHNDVYVYSSSNITPINKWSMVTIVVDRETKTCSYYVNGVLDKKASNFTGDENFSGFSNITKILQNFQGLVCDFKIFATKLSDNDIKDLYVSKAYVSDNQKLITHHLNEKCENSVIDTTYALTHPKLAAFSSLDLFTSSTFDTFKPKEKFGIYQYSQANNHGYFTNDGYRILSKPNLPRDSTYGGMGFQPLDIDKSLLKQGHTYVVTWTMSGQSTRGMSVAWTNYYGWGGGGLSPSPSDIQTNSTNSSNFNGERKCYYKFTINDSIWKTCTTAYSHYELNKTYVSYACLSFNYTYGDTGPLGTDIYIRDLQLFDVTDIVNLQPDISMKSILNAINFDETTDSHLSGEASDMKIKTLDDGTKWARILWHNNNAGAQRFTSEAEALNTQSSYKYSRLYLLDGDKFKNNNKYEFMLEYPWDDNTHYNRWKQTSNPCTSTTVEGYEAVHIDWTGNTWNGIQKDSANRTFIKGSGDSGLWFYSIACYNSFQKGIPSYNSNSTDSVTELWVRIDNTPIGANFNNKEFAIYKDGLSTANEFIEN